MIVANFTTNRSTMSDTRTYEDFYKFLGMQSAQVKLRELLGAPHNHINRGNQQASYNLNGYRSFRD